MFAGVKLWQVAIEIWQVATEIQDKISLIVQLGIFAECHPRLKKKDPKISGYFAFFSASHFLLLLSSSSKFQFEFEGSVEGATSVILEGQYRAPCPCSLHVIQIICAAMVETWKELEMIILTQDVTSSLAEGAHKRS